MIWENRTVKLLGITIDIELKFDEHLTNVCIKANRKLTVLTRMRKNLDFSKVGLLLKTVFESQFKYYPLTWMFYSRKNNNRINKLHERAPWLVYNDYESTFEDNDKSQTILGELFTKNNYGYYMRSKSDFVIPQIRTILKGSNSIRYFRPIIWNLIPEEVKT